jgi:hypothetical protein
MVMRNRYSELTSAAAKVNARRPPSGLPTGTGVGGTSTHYTNSSPRVQAPLYRNTAVEYATRSVFPAPLM